MKTKPIIFLSILHMKKCSYLVWKTLTFLWIIYNSRYHWVFPGYYKKHIPHSNNTPINKVFTKFSYINKVNYWLTFKTKTEYSPKLSTLKILYLLVSSRVTMTKNNKWGNSPGECFCYDLDSGYQHDSRALYSLVPNKSFWPTFKSKVSCNEAWCTELYSFEKKVENKCDQWYGKKSKYDRKYDEKII